MMEDRSEKRTMRGIWIKEVGLAAEQHPNSDVPWYLTLCGGEGKDIELLINEGLISLTEVNSIAEQDQGKIVAIENNIRGIAKLQKRFTGLRIKEVNYQDLTRGDSAFNWPAGEDEKYCRAHVVNLDLNQPLRGVLGNNNAPKFPVLSWVHKLCRLHEKFPQIDWTLCLTLHGELVWPDEVNEWTRQFLAENLNREIEFSNSCRNFLGENLFAEILRTSPFNFKDLDRVSQQKIVMIMVPKYITNSLHSLGWRVHTERNLRYGEGDHAPMVSWILKFNWSSQSTAKPEAVYRTGLKNILTGAGILSGNGRIETTGY